MEFLELIVFMLPCYVANGTPVIIGGGLRLDGGIKLSDGRALLGKTKSVKGFLGGILAGIIMAGILAMLWPNLIFGNPETLFISGVLLSVGALIGDAAGSFIKRRMDIAPGKHCMFLDQMDFIAGGLIFAYPFAYEIYTIPNLIFILVISYILHMGTNMLANRAGIKKVPW